MCMWSPRRLRNTKALIAALHQAHLAVEESIFEAVAAAYAAVLPEDRARGVCLVDIGAQSTHVAIYDGDALLLAATLPLPATTSPAISLTS